jgi:glutamate 5-kinase
LFANYNHTVAQILITGEDIEHADRKQNFINTMSRLLELSALPIINENDSISTKEIEIGDNDTLGAIVATAVDADLLIILSDINGLYTGDPKKDKTAKLLHTVSEITPEIENMVGGAGSSLGTGGMVTKLKAAKIVTKAGIDMVIANGENPILLYDIVDGKDVGTRFLGKAN